MINQNMQSEEDYMKEIQERQDKYFKKMEYEKKMLPKLRYWARKKGLKITKGLSESFIVNPFPEKDAHAFIAEKKYAIKDRDGHLIAGFEETVSDVDGVHFYCCMSIEEVEEFIEQWQGCNVNHVDNTLTGR